MKYRKLLELALEFEKFAQAFSAQSGDIQVALEKANLFNIPNLVSPLVTQANVPDDATVAITIIVSKGPTVGYSVVINPENPAASKKLSALIKAKFSLAMVKAIVAAKLNVDSNITVKWLTF
jgi:hypothetical protein